MTGIKRAIVITTIAMVGMVACGDDTKSPAAPAAPVVTEVMTDNTAVMTENTAVMTENTAVMTDNTAAMSDGSTTTTGG